MKIPAETVLAEVCRRFRVSRRLMRADTRVEPVASYRLLGMALAQELGSDSLTAARAFGRRNHTTALHARKTVAWRRKTERMTREHWDGLKAELWRIAMQSSAPR